MMRYLLLLNVAIILILEGEACNKKPNYEQQLERQRQENKRQLDEYRRIIQQNQEAARQAAEHYAKQMRIQLEDLCRLTCVTQWTPWSACSKPCGGGQRNRTRTIDKPTKCIPYPCSSSLKQTEMCNVGCPNGGSPTGTGCVCSADWTGICCKTAVRCDYPGKPRNGQVFGSWPARYGTMATFTCLNGYYLQGQELVKCSSGGQWAGTKPQCQPIKCVTPPVSKALSILNHQTEYSAGQQVVFECQEGYVLSGPEVRTCIQATGAKGRWNSFQPGCRAVKCGDPGPINHGRRNGTSYTYQAEVTYACNRGYQLMGSDKLKCLANGRWLGTTPQCVQISCPPPIVPKFATVRLSRKATLGSLVTFLCEAGYVLDGEATLECTASGHWNATEPFCRAASCGDPGIPDNGNKDGSVYHYPHKIDYSCQNGYVLVGAHQISCQADGKWTSAKPFCRPCLKGTYMEQFEKEGQCQPCPSHSTTQVTGAPSRRICTCVRGYSGPAGGPCTEMLCPTLFAPMNGTISNCSNTVDSVCEFNCQDGFVIADGRAMVTCQEKGQWDGKMPKCSPCPVDTYKSDEQSCMPCPKHSHTTGVGNMLPGCICDSGFEGPPGGSCNDTNECDTSNGRGPCSDVCENTYGSFRCSCSIPGQTIDEDDLHSCIVENQCKNLTKADAPDNGGLVCHHYREHASVQCGVRCNPLFEFPSRVNQYETCGPTTNFIWSFRRLDQGAVIAACIPELFGGFQFESDVFYFSRACDQMTEQERLEVYRNFKQTLDSNGVCQKSNKKVCNIQDMGIVCGHNKTRRDKRGVLEEVSQVNLTFHLQSLKIGEDPKKDCPRICAFLRIQRAHCVTHLCISAYKRFLKAAVMFARQQLQRIYKNKALRNRLQFKAANRTFEATERIHSKQVEMQCDPGMKGNVEEGWCVPCEAGTKWDFVTKDCVPCPPGTFQLFKNQTACVPCFKGTTSTTSGSLFCSVCDEGFYGDQCAQICKCKNGSCSPLDGTCTCHTGWQGALCDEDIPGCHEENCYPGVTCIDVPAPGTGFRCGSCPPGYQGDGAKCTTQNPNSTNINSNSTGNSSRN